MKRNSHNAISTRSAQKAWYRLCLNFWLPIRLFHGSIFCKLCSTDYKRQISHAQEYAQLRICQSLNSVALCFHDKFSTLSICLEIEVVDLLHVEKRGNLLKKGAATKQNNLHLVQFSDWRVLGSLDVTKVSLFVSSHQNVVLIIRCYSHPKSFNQFERRKSFSLSFCPQSWRANMESATSYSVGSYQCSFLNNSDKMLDQ